MGKTPKPNVDAKLKKHPPALPVPTMYLLVCSRRVGKRIVDCWVASEDKSSIERQYEELLARDDLYSASIRVPIESTDYNSVALKGKKS